MRRSTLTILSLAMAGGLLQAQAPKISGLVQVWYSQMLDSNLRTNGGTAKYFNGYRAQFKENGFDIRRTELKFQGDVLEDVSWAVMIDPAISPSTTNSILQDAAITWKATPALSFSIGQFKSLQTLEGMASSATLQFIDRSQMGNAFGDVRDRGVVATYGFGEAKGLAGKASIGVFNGQGKNQDSNAQKDFAGRLEFTYGKAHSFGFYTMAGSTDQADKGALVAKTFAGTPAPAAPEILDNKDQTRQFGAYYQYQDATWYGAAEAITGTLGRRFPSVGTAGAAAREHLDQKFMGLVLTGSYTMARHTFGLRYDLLNYNSGDQWYGATNPYVTAAGDYSPKFTILVGGYTYALNPGKAKAANLKLNYISRSKNFLKPGPGQTGEQGGDTLLAQFQISF